VPSADDARMRLSDFTILSDALPNGDRILMNGISGALDVVPRLLADHLQGIQANSARGRAYVDGDRLHPETVASLLERGHLTRMTPQQERAVVVEIARGLHEQEKRRPYFMIAPSMDCNYRCVYCFERPLQATFSTGEGIGSRPGPGAVMQLEDVSRVLARIEQIQAQAGAEPGGLIILYGGEPLDARNRDLVVEIVRAGRARGHFFAAVTNGHDLDQFKLVIGPEMIRQIQISFDGPKPLHNRRRIALDGSSSFDRLVSNIGTALEIDGIEIHLRVHVEPASVDRFDELVRLFERLGWTDHPRQHDLPEGRGGTGLRAGGRRGSRGAVGRRRQPLSKRAHQRAHGSHGACTPVGLRVWSPVSSEGGLLLGQFRELHLRPGWRYLRVLGIDRESV
jgi:uncharacterized protein